MAMLVSSKDEEPYSTIFASLKHPIRRKILRMLSKEPMSFSKMLEVLGVSNSFLTYHLENLGELVGKTDDGKYKLSTFGEDAMATMARVEGIPETTSYQSSPTKPKRITGRRARVVSIFFATIPFIVAGALIIASLHLFLFATETSGVGIQGGDIIYVHPNQTYSYNITISYNVFPPNYGGGTSYENGSILVEMGVLRNTLTDWTKVWLPVFVSLNSQFSDIRVSQTLERPSGVFLQGSSYAPMYGEITSSNGTGSIGTGFNPDMTEGGTESVIVENVGSVDANVSISWKVDTHLFDRPYFDYGFTALGIGLLYPVVFVIKEVKFNRG